MEAKDVTFSNRLHGKISDVLFMAFSDTYKVAFEYTFSSNTDLSAVMGSSASYVTLWIFLHPENASLPILVTELGITTEVRSKQSSNALLPIVVTEFGI